MSTFIQKTIGKPYFDFNGYERVKKSEIDQFIEWSNQKLYLTSPDAGEFINWDWIFEKFKEQMFQYGINIFVIDAYNKIEHTGNKTERENITKCLSRLTQFAQQNNVLIILIAHPTKMQKNGEIYARPTLYDVSGSADFRNQTHDGFSVYRYFGDGGHSVFTNLKTKYTFHGEIGKAVQLDYHLPSGRFYPRGQGYVAKSLIEQTQTQKDFVFLQEQSPFALVSPQDAFGKPYNENDEVPF